MTTAVRASDQTIRIDRVLDTSGLQCPLPILKAKVELTRMQPGEVLQIIATDGHAPIDFQVFCQRMGHTFLRLDETSDRLTMLIRKAAD